MIATTLATSTLEGLERIARKENNLFIRENNRPNTMTESFFVKSGQMLYRVKIPEIQWVHSDGNYSTIMTTDRKYAVKISLTKLKQRLPEGVFIQIHRSYIVQKDLIQNIDLSSMEVFVGDSGLPLGRTFKEDLLKQLNLLQ